MNSVLVFKTKGPLATFFDRLTNLVYSAIQFAAWPTAILLYYFGFTANQLTMMRLFFSPITFYLLYSFERSITEYLIAVAVWGYTDAVDGVMSKQFERKSASDVGAMLDAGADKSMTISMYAYHYATFPQLVVVTIVSESILALLSIGSVSYATNKSQVIAQMRATYWGKFKLGFEIVSVILMAWYTLNPEPNLRIAIYCTGATAIFLLAMSLFTKVKKILI